MSSSQTVVRMNAARVIRETHTVVVQSGGSLAFPSLGREDHTVQGNHVAYSALLSRAVCSDHAASTSRALAQCAQPECGFKKTLITHWSCVVLTDFAVHASGSS